MVNMRHQRLRAIVLLAIMGFVMMLSAISVSGQIINTPGTSPEVCRELRFLMDRTISPYDLGVGGGILNVGGVTTGSISDAWYADLWSFNFTKENNQNDTLTLRFRASTNTIPLEFALFLGMDRVSLGNGQSDYQSTDIGEMTIPLQRDGIYTLVVRRASLTEVDGSSGTYTINSSLDSGRQYATLIEPRTDVRDETNNRSVNPPPVIPEGTGYQLINLQADIYTHPNAVSNVSSLSLESTRAEYGSIVGSGFFLNGVYNEVQLFGGDLVVKGNAPETDQPRLLYVQNFDYRTFFGDSAGNLTSIQSEDGTNIQLNWDDLRGVWITQNCAGFMRRDGTKFFTPITPQQRTLTFRTDRTISDDFDIRVTAPSPPGVITRYEIDLNWRGVQPASQMSLVDGMFNIELIGGRSLHLQATRMDIRRVDDGASQVTATTPLSVSLFLRESTLLIDWIDLNSFTLTDTLGIFDFDDTRGTVNRELTNLDRLEIIDGNVYMIFDDSSQSLWLSRENGFIELITPATPFPYNSLAVAGQAGYVPNALNNTGGECYPVNTMLPEANCPPNGYPNPANGNLWYAITDLQAFGGLIDLNLTRNYNSLFSAVDGPFGAGWTGLFLLDYNVQFDATLGSRRIDQAAVSAYPVSLNLIWSPRGIVTFTTPSGSQHTFLANNRNYTGGAQTLTAITMPGWRLQRESVYSDWTLTQPDGLTYVFDPAGRLRNYGYPSQDRVITIDYPRGTLNGPGSLDERPVIISDAPETRQLELYYDEDHHIDHSILRGVDDFIESCRAGSTDDEGAFETFYHYDTGLLTAVDYADCQQATYSYDNNQILNHHDDPRAPIAPQMAYRYDENGFVNAVIEAPDTAPMIWRARTGFNIINNAVNLPDRRQVSIAGDEFAERTYTYQLVRGNALQNIADSYTLITETSPFATSAPASENFESRPISYEWVNGLLTGELLRTMTDDRGRNSIRYTYTPDATLSGVSGGYPTFAATFGNNGNQQNLTFADGSTIAITYDENGFTYIDRQGGRYTTLLNAQNRIETVTSEDDGSATSYTYDDVLGLVDSVTYHLVDEAQETRYTVRYLYDAFGRLIMIDDSSEEGAYTFSYPAPERADGDTFSDIIMTDPSGATTRLRFNGRGKLVENRLTAGGDILVNGQYLRRTTYTYDVQGRLHEETRWLGEIIQSDDSVTLNETPLTTRYDYFYRTFPFDEDGILPTERVIPPPATINAVRAPNAINGYQVIVTQPGGTQQQVYVYDALGRIQQVEDEFRNITRYQYMTDNFASYSRALPNGLRIDQQDYRNNQLTTSSTYLFDFSWRLRFVSRTSPAVNGNGEPTVQTWEFLDLAGENGAAEEVLRAPSAGVNELTWSLFDEGLATQVNVTPMDIRLTSGGTVSRPQISATYDFQGHPVTVQDGAGNTYYVCYTPLDGGHRQTHITMTDDNGCQLTEDSRIIEYDARGRVTFTQDASGTRDYTYTAMQNGWRVDVITREALSGQTFTWEMLYDSAGDLHEWVDEAGIRRIYDYDTLGRLLRVQTNREDPSGLRITYPEASYTYTYNENDLVTSAVNDLQRGTRYAYSNFGLLTVAQDVNTGNAVIYGYNSTGQLNTVISALGSTTTYLYDDPAHPTRITGIIGPTGNTLRFNWDDSNRQLTYTDGRGNRTIYTFDSFDALWRIDDSFDENGNVSRSHEMHYDNAGNLTTWLQSLTRQTPTRELQLTYSDPYTVTFSLPAVADWQRTIERTAYDQLLSLSTTPDTQDIVDFHYDPFGRLSQIITGENSSEEHRVWSLAYNPGTPSVTVNDGFDNVYTLGYDALNQLVSITDPAHELTTTYDYRSDNGPLIVSAAVNGVATERSVTYSPGVEGVRPPTITLDAPGERKTYVYNADGLLDEIRTEICLLTAENIADLPDNEECVTGGDEIVWRTTEQFAYDTENRPIRYIDAENNIATFAYDDVGNLSNYQNLQGQTFNYSYDSLNRLASITGPTGIRLLLDYDGADNVIGICRTRAERELTYTQCENSNNPADFVIETYDYDTLGRLIGQNFPTALDGDIVETTVTQNYDNNSNRITDWGIADEDGVSIQRSRDGLSLVENLTISPQVNGTDIQYDAVDRVDNIASGTADALDYEYDAQGRIDRIITHDHALDYSYDADGSYSVRDETSGAQIHFGLNENGLLNQISYDYPTDANAVSETDTTAEDMPLVSVDIDYRYNTTRRLLTVTIHWSNGEIIELLLDHNGVTRNTIYNVQTNLLIDYVGDADGRVQRRGLTGSSILFEGDTTGYITQIGYDNDGRPFNMRITGRTSGVLLYLLTFTYDQQGQRETETRQYRSGDQINITYHYNEANQLSERTFTIRRTRPFSASGSPLLLLLPLLGGFFKPIRRRALLLCGLFVFCVALIFSFGESFIEAQQSETFNQLFTYNRAGNLESVRIDGSFNQTRLNEVCATYTYDAANRLVEVTRGEASNEISLQTYAYDVYNRLTQAGDDYLAYLGDSNTLIARFNADSLTPIFYGQSLRRSGFFRAEGDNVDWFITDGRQSVLATVPNDQTTGLAEPIENLDPLGRFILLDPLAQSTMIDWCSEIGALSDLGYTQIVEQDMIWDAVTNLYFKNGRAYSPQIGSYLQRDPLGPDVFGNVYNYPSRQAQPPVRMRPPAYAEGLYVLDEAYSTIDETVQITATDILTANLPSLRQIDITPLVDELSATTRLTQEALARELELTAWLRRRYNLPGAFIDDGGALRLLPDTAPAQGGNPMSDPLPDILAVLYPQALPLPHIGTPIERVQGYVTALNPLADPYTTYQPFAWLPDLPTLDDAWSINPPQVGVEYTPQAIFDWLPQALYDPQNATDALRAIDDILEISSTGGASWLENALDSGLPTLPEIPPQTSDEWLDNWFTRDTLGIANSLAQRFPAIPTNDLPVYELARNYHWFDLDGINNPY